MSSAAGVIMVIRTFRSVVTKVVCTVILAPLKFMLFMIRWLTGWLVVRLLVMLMTVVVRLLALAQGKWVVKVLYLRRLGLSIGVPCSSCLVVICTRWLVTRWTCLPSCVPWVR